jgi:hypothetical protein
MWRWVIAWVLIGAIVQLVMLIEARAKFGGRLTEVGLKAFGVRWYHFLGNVALWPLALTFRFMPSSLLMREPFFKRSVAQATEAIDIDGRERCPECGEAWLTHPESCR